MGQSKKPVLSLRIFALLTLKCLLQNMVMLIFPQRTGLKTLAMENVRELNYKLTAYPLVTVVAMQHTHI